MPNKCNDCTKEEKAVEDAKDSLSKAREDEVDAILALASEDESGSAIWFVLWWASIKATKARKNAEKELESAKDALDECKKCHEK